ncbi:MAG: hypothetical protein SWH68_10330 [Thermodesulfobacteriota bacterium]|nr:hypothetical protein [Thermodesulfobacteriota bacterium]
MNVSDKGKSLSQKKIYFGHQSVGFNIIDGIKDIMNEDQELDLNIKETSDPKAFSEPLFAHSRNGENRDWQSKINDFQAKIQNGLGEKADIAFFKLCYVDVTEETNVEKLFKAYKQTMADLAQKFPDTVFLHATVPLKTANTGWKTWIKKLIGKDYIWEYVDNIKRNEFNDLIRNEYEDTNRLFDIARIESTLTDGSREIFKHNGKEYEAMAPDFTYDGGHLNKLGGKIVAKGLLKVIKNL